MIMKIPPPSTLCEAPMSSRCRCLRWTSSNAAIAGCLRWTCMLEDVSSHAFERILESQSAATVCHDMNLMSSFTTGYCVAPSNENTRTLPDTHIYIYIYIYIYMWTHIPTKYKLCLKIAIACRLDPPFPPHRTRRRSHTTNDPYIYIYIYIQS